MRRRCAGVASTWQAKQPGLPGGSANGSDRHHPRALCGLRADACGREACGTAWHPSWPRDDPAMDDGGRAVEGPPTAAAASASAALPSRLRWRIDPDRRLAALVVRDARTAMHAAGLYRRCNKSADASAVRGDGVDVRLFRGDTGLSRALWLADRVLFRQTCRVSVQQEGRGGRWW